LILSQSSHFACINSNSNSIQTMLYVHHVLLVFFFANTLMAREKRGGRGGTKTENKNRETWVKGLRLPSLHAHTATDKKKEENSSTSNRFQKTRTEIP